MNKAGLALIKHFEGCELVAHPDAKTGGAPWTCGWGATGPDVRPGVRWTQAQADARLLSDIAKREERVRRAVTVPLNENQLAALVSIVFNVGEGVADKPGRRGRDGILVLRDGRASTLIRKLNEGDYQGCADQFLRWVSPGSSVERGLRRRREAERELFLRPV